jgi:ParB family chromosome partitioning protein
VKGREVKNAAPEGKVEIARIEVRDEMRLRPVSEAGVQSVMSSIEELGLMKDPIHLRLKRGLKGAEDRLVLIAGAHRLEAATRLGWTEVPARVWECSDDWARLMEVDDNLAGSELSPLDMAVFLAERKRLYEALHPETKAGVAGGKVIPGKKITTDMMSVASFAVATAEKFGMSDRHVRRMIHAGGFLAPHEVSELRGAPRPVSLADLQQIAKLSDAAERGRVVRLLHDGHARSAAVAIKAARGVPERARRDPEDAAFNALVTAWERAPRAAKLRFRRWLKEAGD